jgi:hypothetical protein
MGRLFEIRKAIDQALSGKPNQFVLRGQIGMAAGVLIGGINEKTPDDAEKIQKLAQAAKQVLGIQV